MAQLIPCIHFTRVSSRGRARLSSLPRPRWSAAALPAALGGHLPGSLQASPSAHPNFLCGGGVMFSSLAIKGKWDPRLWVSALLF